MVVTITATLTSKANTENAEKPHIKVNWQAPKKPQILQAQTRACNEIETSALN